MCGRYASTTPPDLLAKTLAAMLGATNLEPNWNLAPSQNGPVVRLTSGGQRQLDALTWGLVPHWTQDLKSAPKPINARAETVAGSRLFREAFAHRRALIPADLFYEWRTMPDGKQPYAIARTDTVPLMFGGLWEGWRDPQGEVVRSYTILTTAANADMAPLHARMPLVLEPQSWAAWLGETSMDPATLLRPAPQGTLRCWPVSRAVNAVRNNGPTLIDRVDDPAAPPPSMASPGLNSA